MYCIYSNRSGQVLTSLDDITWSGYIYISQFSASVSLLWSLSPEEGGVDGKPSEWRIVYTYCTHRYCRNFEYIPACLQSSRSKVPQGENQDLNEESSSKQYSTIEERKASKPRVCGKAICPSSSRRIRTVARLTEGVQWYALRAGRTGLRVESCTVVCSIYS